jgi:hypothetical protein
LFDFAARPFNISIPPTFRQKRALVEACDATQFRFGNPLKSDFHISEISTPANRRSEIDRFFRRRYKRFANVFQASGLWQRGTRKLGAKSPGRMDGTGSGKPRSGPAMRRVDEVRSGVGLA